MAVLALKMNREIPASLQSFFEGFQFAYAVDMHSDVEELALTPGEREVASEHWDAMMFAPSRIALESARLDLMEAPFSVQHAVIAAITANWLDEYEPEREENPFLPPIQVIVPASDDSTIDDDLLWQREIFLTDSASIHTAPSYFVSSASESSSSLSSYAQRLIQNMSHLHMPRIGGRMASPNSSL